MKLKGDFQAYVRQSALAPRRTCLQVWDTGVGMTLDIRAEFGPTDMPDLASQVSDLSAQVWGQRAENILIQENYYQRDARARAFQQVRKGKFQGRQLWCHVESIYEDDVHGAAPEGLPARVQREVFRKL